MGSAATTWRSEGPGRTSTTSIRATDSDRPNGPAPAPATEVRTPSLLTAPRGQVTPTIGRYLSCLTADRPRGSGGGSLQPVDGQAAPQPGAPGRGHGGPDRRRRRRGGPPLPGGAEAGGRVGGPVVGGPVHGLGADRVGGGPAGQAAPSPGRPAPAHDAFPRPSAVPVRRGPPGRLHHDPPGTGPSRPR